eukprot:COSAG01_NODE_2066_length_8507_cov_3.752141_8_plen_22_part_01
MFCSGQQGCCMPEIRKIQISVR